MEHGPAMKWGDDKSIQYKRKVGILFFAIYAVVYAGFVIINTLAPKTMEARVIFGLNLAVFYGYGLIILAILAGLLYNLLCGRKELELNKGADES
jgi:uncharacterized membrane protein (DUF485 family)